MKFTQIRHGTCIFELDKFKFLIDPILYKKGTFKPIKGGAGIKNPLSDIIVDENTLRSIDAIILTHLHYDHFDPEIIKFYGKNIPIICSMKYKKKLFKLGFSNINFVEDKIEINGMEIFLTKGEHGSGIIRLIMGKSYGFIIKTKDKNVVYITGDTIWCKYVKEAIESHSPNYIIGFAGSAKINNVHITLDENDIIKILKEAPNAKLIVNHMDAWNHCVLTKEHLRKIVNNKNLIVPNDGETIDVNVKERRNFT